MSNVNRRGFMERVILGASTILVSSCNNDSVNNERINENPINSPIEDNPIMETLENRIHITSAYWNNLSISAARNHPDRYDTVWIPGIEIKEDGTLRESDRTKNALVEGKPNLYIIQNYPEGTEWNAERASAFMNLKNSQLRDELARFEDGVVLDLESMTSQDNRNYHNFIERVRKAYDGTLIVSLHAKVRLNGEIQGLGKEMNYKAITDIADGMDYMTLDYWPGNPREAIGTLQNFRSWLDCLFEEEIDRKKVMASIPTYIKVSYLNQNGEIDESREPFQNQAEEVVSDLTNLRIEEKKEGQFTADYKKERVRGWMMTEDAFKARVDLLKGYEMNKVAFWYGDLFVENTPNLRDIVYSA